MKNNYLFLLLFLSFAGKAQNYLLKSLYDTVWIDGKIYPDHTNPASWKKLVINDSTYRVRNITGLYYEGQSYRRAGKRLWKRVLSGKINVYARNEQDTLCNRQGTLKKVLMLQKGDEGILLPAHVENQLLLMSDDEDISNFLKQKIRDRNRSKGMIIGSAITCGSGFVIVLFSGFISLLRNDSGQIVENDDLEIAAICGAALMSGGGLSLAKSLVNFNHRKRYSLELIRLYNKR